MVEFLLDVTRGCLDEEKEFEVDFKRSSFS